MWEFTATLPGGMAQRHNLFWTRVVFAIEGENTIVCDGKGGVRIHLSPNTNPDRRRCGVRDCIQEHEKYHQAYALKMDPGICAGSPPVKDGVKVTPSDTMERNTQEYIGTVE